MRTTHWTATCSSPTRLPWWMTYDFGQLDEVSLACAVTIHKSRGSEFTTLVIPVAMQHYMLLQRNLIYTGITRAKRLLVVIGQK